MAESAAHFTATAELKPSIFDIVAQSSLNSTLHPAFQKVATFLASAKPKQFSWLTRYHEEAFLALNGLLQYHYLKHANASFSEHFYSLQRVSGRNIFSQLDKHKAILFLVLFPYLKRKLEERIQVYRIQSAEGSLPNNATGKFKQAAILLHTLTELGAGWWTLLQYLLYMSDRTSAQSPALKLAGQKLVYAIEPEDAAGFWRALFKGQLGFSEGCSGILLNMLRSGLEVSAFLIQFLNAWNAERSNYDLNALPTVEPPNLDAKSTTYTGRCPLCLQKWKIPTVLPVSGYVFCFPCIVRYLRDHSKCPVTGLPTKPLDIVRLYDE